MKTSVYKNDFVCLHAMPICLSKAILESIDKQREVIVSIGNQIGANFH